MGNRKLRKQVADLLKKKNIGKLYYGDKRSAWKWFHAHELRHLIELLSYEPGDLINDCDMFNHQFVELDYEYRNLSKWWGLRPPIKVFNCEQVMMENGKLSCGCPTSPEPGKTKDRINYEWKRYLNDCYDPNELDERNRAMLDALNRGESICDDNGMCLPQYQRGNY